MGHTIDKDRQLGLHRSLRASSHLLEYLMVAKLQGDLVELDRCHAKGSAVLFIASWAQAMLVEASCDPLVCRSNPRMPQITILFNGLVHLGESEENSHNGFDGDVGKQLVHSPPQFFEQKSSIGPPRHPGKS